VTRKTQTDLTTNIQGDLLVWQNSPPRLTIFGNFPLHFCVFFSDSLSFPGNRNY